MSSSNNDSGTAPLPKPPKAWVTLLMGGILVFSGMVIGGGITALAIHNLMDRGRDGNSRMDDRVVDRLSRDLDLSEEQQGKLREILKSHNERFMEIRRNTSSEIDYALSSMGDEIKAVLTPEQTEQWEAKFKKVRRKMMPGFPHRYNKNDPRNRRGDHRRGRDGDSERRHRHGDDERPRRDNGETGDRPPPPDNELGERPEGPPPQR